MSAKKESTTGRSWTCPKCGFVYKEAAIKHSEVVCNRELKCRHGGGTVMKLSEPE
jgi:hypothetical protein